MNMQKLTTREKEVGLCLIEGMTAKEVSKKLTISVHTVEGHQRTIKRKLKAKTPYHIGCLLGRAFSLDSDKLSKFFSNTPHT